MKIGIWSKKVYKGSGMNFVFATRWGCETLISWPNNNIPAKTIIKWTEKHIYISEFLEAVALFPGPV